MQNQLVQWLLQGSLHETLKYYPPTTIEDYPEAGPDVLNADIDQHYVRTEDKARIFFPRYMVLLKQYLERCLAVVHDLPDPNKGFSPYVKQKFAWYLDQNPGSDKMDLARGFPLYVERVLTQLNLDEVGLYYISKPKWRAKYLRYCKDYVQGKVDKVTYKEGFEVDVMNENFPKTQECYKALLSEWAQIQRREAKLCLEDKLVFEDFSHIIAEISVRAVNRESYFKPEVPFFKERLKTVLLALIAFKQKEASGEKSMGYRL